MLNKIISWTLIFILSFNCLGKLGYITYYQVNKAYIMEVLCINKSKPELKCEGTCFLKKKLADAEQSHSQLPDNFKQLEIPVFLVTYSDISFINPEKITQKHAHFIIYYNSLNRDKVFHPPLYFVS